MGMDVVKQAVETIKRMYNLSLLKLLERLPVENGGTGGATAEQARENLGIQFPLPIANGGTGGTTASAALTNLGLPVTYGTWTPVLFASDGGMTYTTSYNYAYYCSIGRLVYITFYMKVMARSLFATGSYSNNTEGEVGCLRDDGTIRIQSANGTAALKWNTGDTWVGYSGCYIKA